MWWKRSGRPRSATSTPVLAAIAPSDPRRMRLASPWRPVSDAPIPSSEQPADSPPVNR